MISLKESLKIPNRIALSFLFFHILSIIYWSFTINNSLIFFKKERIHNKVIYGSFLLAHLLLNEKNLNISWITSIDLLISRILFPCLEEYIFRYWMARLANFKWWWIPLSSFLFAIAHYPNAGLINFIMGLVFAAQYHYSQNLSNSLLFHVSNNLTNFIFNIMVWNAYLKNPL